MTRDYGGTPWADTHETEATGEQPVYITKEDWNEKHPLYRKGIEWRENMSETRARIYADDFDERAARRELIERGKDKYGFLKGTVPGFFSSMLGNIPDPINLVPFGAGAKVAGAGLGSALKSGVVSGVLSNAAVDAIVLPDLKRRGDDIGFADFALDMVFGAALGGLFSGAGYGMSKWARHTIHGEDRLAVLNAFEDSVARVANGEAVNVGEILNTPGNKLYGESFLETPERVNEFVDFALSESGKGVDANLPFRNVGFPEALRVQVETGIDISGFRHELSTSSLRHIMNKHSEPHESYPGNIPLTKEDITHISDIIENPDSIENAGKNRDAPVIKYSKTFPDGTTYFLEIIATAKKRLSPLTMYKVGKAGSDVSARAAPTPYVRNRAALDSNIFQSDLPVNRFAVETPDTFTPAPEPVNRTVLEEMGADPKTGVTPEELLAEQFADVVPEEHINELRQAQAEDLARKQREDAGYEIMGCVYGVNDGD